MTSFVVISFIIGFVLVGILADKANRSVAGWILLSFIISPIIAALILYFINPSEEFKKKTGLEYLLILFGLIALVISAFVQMPIKSGKGSKNTYEIAQSSQMGSVRILSFEAKNFEYAVQVQNNTNEEIKRTDYRIIFYDKDGNQIDYYDKTSVEAIDAHMTKIIKLDKGFDEPKHFDKAAIKVTNFSYVSSSSY